MTRLTQNRYPMLVAVIPFMAGIVLFDLVAIPVWALWGGFLLCLLVAAVGLRSSASNLYIVAALVLFGGVVASLRGFHPQVPAGEKTYLVVEIEDNPVIRKRFAVTPARVVKYECNGTMRDADERVNLYLDTLVKADFGTRIEALGRVIPFPEKFGAYGRLMSRRGFGGTLFLRADDVLKVENSEKRSLHIVAVDRLSRLGLSGDEAATIGAMAVGDRRGMTPELREVYARAGASHILAVSGLHVGIVFMIFNLMLVWMSFVHRGHVVRAVLVVVPIWIYAAICGFSPSVVRAAVMFSVLQGAVITSSRYVSLNVLSATAFAMLVYRPDQLFDISFQLSFIAVIAILIWGIPLMRMLRTRRWWIDALTATMVVGMVSSIATMPLVAHTFGVVSIVGVLLNSIVIICAYIIVILAVVWIAAPFAPLAVVCESLLSGVGAGLNFVVEGVAAWRWSAVDISLPAWAVWLIYGVAIAITVAVRNTETKKTVNLSL
ncbi:MAG: ComEC/Rec2 family competence protein [Alistipes sp.]|nr:ComEC/Rec2 family competence protein [Alistipes sp.]